MKLLRMGVFGALGAIFGVAGAVMWTIKTLDHGQLEAQIAANGTAALGPIGDFVGGILNPAISLVALVWIAMTYLTQREQLIDARAALAAADESRQQQSKYERAQIQIGAITALINWNTFSIQQMQSTVEFVVSQESFRAGSHAFSLPGAHMNMDEARRYVKGIKEHSELLYREQVKLDKRIRDLLDLVAEPATPDPSDGKASDPPTTAG